LNADVLILDVIQLSTLSIEKDNKERV